MLLKFSDIPVGLFKGIKFGKEKKLFIFVFKIYFNFLV